MSTDNPQSGWWRECAVAATPAVRIDRCLRRDAFRSDIPAARCGSACDWTAPAAGAASARDHSESATDDSIADIHAHDRKELRRRGVEIVGRAVIKVPIEHEVSGENTAAGYRGDVCHLGQKASVPQKTDQPEII